MTRDTKIILGILVGTDEPRGPSRRTPGEAQMHKARMLAAPVRVVLVKNGKMESLRAAAA